MAVRCFEVLDYPPELGVVGAIPDFLSLMPVFPERQKVIGGGEFAFPRHGPNQLRACTS